MPTLWEAWKGVRGGSKEVLFLNDVLRQYRDTRKVYNHTYEDEDKKALQACARDLRPFTYSFLPAGASYWALGKALPNPKGLGFVTRTGLVLVRLLAAGEVFRLGYLVGSYKQCVDCSRRLVSLRSALGGEITAIIRQRDPNHPLLRLERPPAELLEDGSRPRIATEANRLARIAQFQQELAQAKRGQKVDRAAELADERLLYQVMGDHNGMLADIQQGGGAAAAASSGKMEAAWPQVPPSHSAEYEAEPTAWVAGSNSSARNGSSGIVITERPWQQQSAMQQPLSAAASSDRGGDSSGSVGSGPGSAENPLAMVLGSSAGDMWAAGGPDGAQDQAVEQTNTRQARRKQRRAQWWWRHSSGQAAGDGG